MKVVFVVGPTASGKSSLALQLGSKQKSAIINCDSIQCYQGLKIGSALPSDADMKILPHFLYSFVEKGKSLTAGEYARNFFSLCRKIENDFEVVYVVGGTGFYFQALEKGMFEVPAADVNLQGQIEQELKQFGSERLHQELQSKDPLKAIQINKNDHYRLVRALEVIRRMGRPLSEIEAEFKSQIKPFPYPLFKIGIRAQREQLLPQIELRTQNMIESGLIKEVEDLLSEGYGDWDPLSSVGYRETVEWLNSGDGHISSLKEKIIVSTWQLAKKQKTWFQRDEQIHWVELQHNFSSSKMIPELSDKILDFLKTS